jgi:hypothetical protein
MPKKRSLVKLRDKNIINDKTRIEKFYKRVANGQHKISAFREIFTECDDWHETRIWRYINYFMSTENALTYLKRYRKRWLEMLDQKKVDMLMYLEQEIIYSSDPAIQIKDKLKAIETYAKLAGFTAPTPTVIQQLNVQSDTQKELFNIFGIDDDSKQIEEKPEVIDAEIIETNEDPIEDF